jgi:hypothetical protein
MGPGQPTEGRGGVVSRISIVGNRPILSLSPCTIAGLNSRVLRKPQQHELVQGGQVVGIHLRARQSVVRQCMGCFQVRCYGGVQGVVGVMCRVRHPYRVQLIYRYNRHPIWLYPAISLHILQPGIAPCRTCVSCVAYLVALLPLVVDVRQEHVIL